MQPLRNAEARARIEIELLRRSLVPRIDRLEAAARPAEAPKAWPARLVGWMGSALPQLIGSAVMLVLGFMVKDSVDFAIRQQQLQLSYLAQMKAELVEMAKTGAAAEDIERSAMLLAAFGRPAAMPLINELRYGGNRAVGAEAGLRALAFADPDSVCRLLLRAMESAAVGFDAESHAGAVRLLVASECTRALPMLRRQLGEANLLAKTPADARGSGFLSEVPTTPQLKAVIRELEGAIPRLEALRPLWSWP